jgi:hypothetical protein
MDLLPLWELDEFHALHPSYYAAAAERVLSVFHGEEA